MPIEILKSVDDLRHQLEQARSSLKSTDENIKRLIGRDPSELPPRNLPLKRPLDDKNATRGPPKIVRRNELFTSSSESRRKDNNDNSKRRNPNSVFSRLSDKVVAEEPIGPTKGVTSKVIVTPKEVPSRQKAIDDQSRDVKFKERNKRMFGALLGTLQKFQQEETKQKKRVEKKAQIEKKIEEHEIKEKEEIRKEKQELFYNRRKKQTEIKILELKMTRMREYNQWEEKQRPRLNFILTKAKPHIHFLPRRMDDKSKEFLEKSAAEIERAIEKKRDEVSDELKRIEERMMKSFEQKFGLNRNKDSDEHDLEHETDVDHHFDLDAIVQDVLKNDTHVKSQIKKIDKDNNGGSDVKSGAKEKQAEAVKDKQKEPKEKVIEGNEKENVKKSSGKNDERHEKVKSRRSRSLFKESSKKRSLRSIDSNDKTTSKSQRSPRKGEEIESDRKATQSITKSPEKSISNNTQEISPEKQSNSNENLQIRSRSRSKSNEKHLLIKSKDDNGTPTRSHSKSVDRQSTDNKQENSRSNSPRTPSKIESNKSLKSQSKSPERQSRKSDENENEKLDLKTPERSINNRSKSRSISESSEKETRKTKKNEITKNTRRRSSSSSSSERETKKSNESDKKKSKSASKSPERKSRKTKLNTKIRSKNRTISSSDLSSSSSDSDSSPERKSKKEKETKTKRSPKRRSRKDKDKRSKNRARHSSDDSESDSSVSSRSSSSSSYSSASSPERKSRKEKGKNENDSSKVDVYSPRRKTSVDRDLILNSEITSSKKDNDDELNHHSNEITNKDEDMQDIYSDLHDNEEMDLHQADMQSEPISQSNINIHFSQNNYQYDENQQQQEIPGNQHQINYSEPMSQEYQEPSYENNAPPIEYQNNLNMQQQAYQNNPMDYQNSGNHLFISSDPQFQNDPNVSASYTNNSNFQPPIMSAPSMQPPPLQFSGDPNMAHPPPPFTPNLNQQFRNNPPHFQNNTGPHFPPPNHQNVFPNPPPNFSMPPMPPNFGPPQNMPPPQSNISVPVSFPNESMGYQNNPQFPPPNQPYANQEFSSSSELSEPGFPPVQRNFQNPPPIRMQFRHATPPKQPYHNTQNLVSLTQSPQRPPFGPRGRGRGNMFSGGT